jgi:hypothetical protein
MANLNRYSVRIQSRRVISIDALNTAHAKTLAEEDVLGLEDTEKVKAQNATLTATDVGVENGQTLDRFDVTVLFRRNYVTDALDNQDARYWAETSLAEFDDLEPGSVQYQQVTFMQENTGVA